MWMGKGQITIIPKLEFEDLSLAWKGSTDVFFAGWNFFNEVMMLELNFLGNFLVW